MRRARDVHESWEDLLRRCARQRNEWLQLPKTRLGMFVTLAGDWSTIGTLLADPADVAFLEGLHAAWNPRLRVSLAQTNSPEKLRAAFQQLALSVGRFNRRWKRFVYEIELTKLNERRAAYNRYYVLEKECALRSAALARQGFQPLSLVTTDDLFREFPLIRIPKLRD